MKKINITKYLHLKRLLSIYKINLSALFPLTDFFIYIVTLKKGVTQKKSIIRGLYVFCYSVQKLNVILLKLKWNLQLNLSITQVFIMENGIHHTKT